MAVMCEVTDHEAGLRAVLRGSLAMPDIGSLRLRLYKCLAEQPAALLVDLSQLDVVEPLALTVLTTVARQAGRWPGIPVLLCAPREPVVAMLTDATLHRLPVFATVEQAAAEVGDQRRSMPALSDEVLPITGAVRQARDMVTDACFRWDLARLIGPASLIVDELVSNVADHAGTMATLRLSVRSRHLTIAVEDGSSKPPVLAPGPHAGQGRGLLLVQATAYAWGWMPTEGGKVVWATLRLKA